MVLIKTPEEIEKLKEGGRILAEILKTVAGHVKPGISTQDLEDQARQLCQQAGAVPAFLGYVPNKDKNLPEFPAALCASVNEEIVHCPPGKRTLQEGDILTLDMGIKYKGLYTDSALTVPVGKISREAEKLIKAVKEALYAGIREVRPGNTVGDISHAIERVGKKYNLGVIKELIGHGVGHSVHEPPEVPNYGKPGTLEKLEPGMVLAIEPMFTLGGWRIKVMPDQWTISTRDGSLSAHFEHTVAVTEQGHLVLTR